MKFYSTISRPINGVSHQMNHAFFVGTLLTGQRPPLVHDDSSVDDVVGDGEGGVSDHRVGRKRALVVYLRKDKSPVLNITSHKESFSWAQSAVNTALDGLNQDES